MKPWQRIILFLMLNVLVSACTTLLVLLAWDQWQGPLPRGLLPEALANLRRATVSAPPAIGGTPLPPGTPAQEYIIYQVKPGDTFQSIAASFGISAEELMAINGFSSSQALGVGETLRIPAHPKGGVVIESVIGAGNLDEERVLLKHQGEGELSLVGWRLEDGKGNVFLFPQFPSLTLFKGGAVYIYTRKGTNTVVELYWGLDQAIWRSGVVVTLRDAQGNVRATYTVP